MGRTNPTYWDALRAIEERWTDFRRALRRRDQPHFDRLFEYAREHEERLAELEQSVALHDNQGEATAPEEDTGGDT